MTASIPYAAICPFLAFPVLAISPPFSSALRSLHDVVTTIYRQVGARCGFLLVISPYMLFMDGMFETDRYWVAA
jgi:hypothetical protein